MGNTLTGWPKGGRARKSLSSLSVVSMCAASLLGCATERAADPEFTPSTTTPSSTTAVTTTAKPLQQWWSDPSLLGSCPETDRYWTLPDWLPDGSLTDFEVIYGSTFVTPRFPATDSAAALSDHYEFVELGDDGAITSTLEVFGNTEPVATHPDQPGAELATSVRGLPGVIASVRGMGAMGVYRTTAGWNEDGQGWGAVGWAGDPGRPMTAEEMNDILAPLDFAGDQVTDPSDRLVLTGSRTYGAVKENRSTTIHMIRSSVAQSDVSLEPLDTRDEAFFIEITTPMGEDTGLLELPMPSASTRMEFSGDRWVVTFDTGTITTLNDGSRVLVAGQDGDDLLTAEVALHLIDSLTRLEDGDPRLDQLSLNRDDANPTVDPFTCYETAG